MRSSTSSPPSCLPAAPIQKLFVDTMFDWTGPELAGKHPEKWQSEVLQAIRDGLPLGKAIRIAVATGHGVGKTALTCWIIALEHVDLPGLQRHPDRIQRSAAVHPQPCRTSKVVSAISWSRLSSNSLPLR